MSSKLQTLLPVCFSFFLLNG